MKCINSTIKCVVQTSDRGFFIGTKESWDGDLDIEFTIEGSSNQRHAADPRAKKRSLLSCNKVECVSSSE